MNANQLKTAENMLAEIVAFQNVMSDMLTTDKADDTVLTWENGLCVVMDEGKHPRAAGVVYATAFRPGDSSPDFAFPVIMNGKRETAVPRLRRAVLIDAIRKGEEAIEIFRRGIEDAKRDAGIVPPPF